MGLTPEKEPTFLPKELSTLLSKLESLEAKLERKLDAMRAGFVSWKAFILILPLIFGATAWLLGQHQAGVHKGSVSASEFTRTQGATQKSLDILNDRLEKFSEAVNKNSVAVERLSTTIELVVENK